jgi:hypothetical protein
MEWEPYRFKPGRKGFINKVKQSGNRLRRTIVRCKFLTEIASEVPGDVRFSTESDNNYWIA